MTEIWMTGKSDGDKVYDLGRKKTKEKKETKVSSYTTCEHKKAKKTV